MRITARLVLDIIKPFGIVNLMVVDDSPSLDLVFHALAHPARRAIIRQLSGGERNLSELASPLRMTFPAASKHVRVLEEARLVRRRIAGREHLCRLHAAPLDEAMHWTEQLRQSWEARFQVLDSLLDELRSEPRPQPPPPEAVQAAVPAPSPPILTQEQLLSTTPGSGLRISTPTDTTIVMTRAFNAPRRLVWEAMLTPDKMRRWMLPPAGWILTVCECVPRVGGQLNLAWKSDDADPAMTLRGVFTEVVLHERAVHTETMALGSGQVIGSLVEKHEFREDRGLTFLHITQTYDSKEARDGAIASGMDEGMEACYQTLDALLAEQG